MKTKLLKKLRKKAYSIFRVRRVGHSYNIERFVTECDFLDTYKIWRYHTFENSQEKAIKNCDKLREKEFFRLVEEYARKKGRVYDIIY